MIFGYIFVSSPNKP